MSSSGEVGQSAVSLIVRGGGKRDSPFVLAPCPAGAAAGAMLAWLRGFGIHHRLWWRIIAWDMEGPGRESIATETVEFTETEIVTSRMRYHFDVSAVEGDPRLEHPRIAWIGPEGFTLPYELGWLHFDGGRVNSDVPGDLDLSFAYSALESKGTVFFYNRRPSGKSMAEELREVVAVINAGNPHHSWPEQELGPFLTKFFNIGQDLSLVAVAQYGPFFIKLRLTFRDHYKLREMMSGVLQALSMCGPARDEQQN